MRAIIPVAGFGSRMRPHTHTQPKVLMRVAGKPMLDHIIDDLVDAGVDGVTLVVGYLGDRIEAHVREKYPNLTVECVVQEEMLGLGHAIWMTKHLHQEDERILIILGDTIVKADFQKMFDTGDSVLAVKAVDDPKRFGTVELEKGTDRITALIEKAENPPTNLAIVGVYLLNHPALLFAGLQHLVDNDVRTKGEIQLTDALAYMLQHNNVMRSFEIAEWLDCGKPETLFETNARLLELQGNDVDPSQFSNSVIVNPISVGKNVTIENSIVGPYVDIADDVVIRNSIIKNSTINNRAQIEQTVAHESMIGEDTSISGFTGKINVGDHSTLSEE